MERQGNFGNRMKKVVLQESKASTAVAQPEENKVPRDSSRRGGGKVGSSAEVCAAGGGRQFACPTRTQGPRAGSLVYSTRI